MRINANGLYYRELNELIYRAVDSGAKDIILDKVNGQRYIGCGLSGDIIKITVKGVPGNDLAAFMDGPTVVVTANGQDGIGNTMNAGKVVIHGDVGDITGHCMRGGKIYIKGCAGYRVGIHMKSYQSQSPVIVVGGSARDFLGEYMAGGIIVVLGINQDKRSSVVGEYIGVGMHGGTIYIRGETKNWQFGKEVEKMKWNKEDGEIIQPYLKEFTGYFNMNLEKILEKKFTKLVPHSQRPYGKIYAY